MDKAAHSEQKYSFEEYKLYYESAEKVTDRRLATNTWNYGLCIAVMIAIATLASWTLSRSEFRLVTIVAILILAGMGALLCALWIGQIRDFKDLNSAKFEVLNAMAPLVRFGPTDDRISYEPFSNEWKILQKNEATREVSAMKIVALRSSNAEFLVPTAFRWLFVLIIGVAILTAILNWTTLTAGMFDLGRPPAGTTATQPTAPTGKP